METSAADRHGGPPAPERWHWKGPTVVLSVLTLVVAVVGLGRDVFDFEIKPDPVASPVPTPTTPAARPAVTGASAAVPLPAPEGDVRLLDLEPVAGAALIRVTAASVFDLPCATNTDRDRERAVRFAVPRGYGGFRSRVVSRGSGISPGWMFAATTRP
jgi:hypothetical protein